MYYESQRVAYMIWANGIGAIVNDNGNWTTISVVGGSFDVNANGYGTSTWTWIAYGY